MFHLLIPFDGAAAVQHHLVHALHFVTLLLQIVADTYNPPLWLILDRYAVHKCRNTCDLDRPAFSSCTAKAEPTCRRNAVRSRSAAASAAASGVCAASSDASRRRCSCSSLKALFCMMYACSAAALARSAALASALSGCRIWSSSLSVNTMSAADLWHRTLKFLGLFFLVIASTGAWMVGFQTRNCHRMCLNPSLASAVGAAAAAGVLRLMQLGRFYCKRCHFVRRCPSHQHGVSAVRMQDAGCR